MAAQWLRFDTCQCLWLGQILLCFFPYGKGFAALARVPYQPSRESGGV